MKKQKRNNWTLMIAIVLIGVSLISWQLLSVNKIKDRMGTFTQIKFDQIEIDLGQLKQGLPQTAIFKFTNSGEHSLVIQEVETSCGCIESEWPKHPIKLGQSGEIKVAYDAKHLGRFVKSITVFCNSKKRIEKLVVKGTVNCSQ